MHAQYSRTIRLQEELERRILHGLSCEWETGINILPPLYRYQLKKPMFSLQNMKNRLGCWTGYKKEITLNRHFVLNHSWDSVREVLLHEMAHQVTEQVFRVYHEPPHGEAFQKACWLLRANPEASGAYPPLRDRVFGDAGNTQDKILMRIKKLMALAQSRNTHEAETAMLKAHELIAKYNVELLSQRNLRNFVSVFIGKPTLRRFREEYYLAHLLQDFYFVQGIWVPAYVIDKGKMGKVLEISGAVQNVKIADYVHQFVEHFIEVQWQKYNKDKRLNRSRRTDFAEGVIRGFRSKLEAQTATMKPHEKFALMTVGDPQMTDYISYRYPYMRRFRRQASGYDKQVISDGVLIGKTLVISKGITETGDRQVKLLLTD